MPTILLLSKDTDYRDLMISHFSKSNFEILYTDTIKDCVELIETNKVDLVLCDHFFGNVSICQVAEIVHSIDMTIIMVSLGECFANLNLSNYFESNIKEFIRKKNDLKLTEYRLLTLLEKREQVAYQSKEGNLVSYVENIEINFEQNTIYHHSKAIHVTQLEFNLLKLFLENKNKLLKREQIIETIWKEHTESNLRKVDSFVKKLRQKLNLKCIKSVRGLGYKWIE
ncbi:DNA-binding response OmpR family regulator [Bacilli bacterium PM5-3]|nr:DNA-binding response OmpR family regulator [Bacilli bacterium PM5-3]MDH6604352.1 DNA-binding response OmpR family regulator [Bacilli bacterium PM5-9]